MPNITTNHAITYTNTEVNPRFLCGERVRFFFNLNASSYLLIVCLFMLPQVAQQVLENKERENEIQSLVHELRNKEVGSQTVLVPTFD